MHVGISSPVTIQEFLSYLDEESQYKANGIIGLKAPAVDIMIHSFLKNGHKISIYTLTTEVKSRVVLKGENIKIYINPLRANGKLKALSFFKREANYIFESIKLEPNLPDIIHAHWTYEYSKGVLKFKDKIPVIITVRDWAPKILKLNLNYYRLARFMMDFNTFKTSNITFLANSLYIKEKVKNRWGLDIVSIPNAISDEFIISDLRINKERRFIVSVSNNISKAKNIEKLLKAFKKNEHILNNIQLNLVGKQFYEYVPKVRIWREMGLLKNVNLIGEVDHKKLIDEYDKAVIIVHPSLEESFGNTIIEAMSRGVPVIGGKFSGAVPHILDYGKVGILCDVSSEDEIATSLCDLLNNQTLMDELALKGIDTVKINYSEDAIYNQTLEFYQKLIKQ